MYPLAETPVHEALPVFGLTKLCRVNSWMPALNPYKWKFYDKERLRGAPKSQETEPKEEIMDVEKLSPMMKSIRLYLIKKQYEIIDQMNLEASKEEGQDEVLTTNRTAYNHPDDE